MAIRIDPENNETRAMFALADFTGQHMLEIGWLGREVELHMSLTDFQ